MKINFFESSSILKRFLIFNFVAFLFLGIFTLLYLNAIEPNLIKSKSSSHLKIINNTINHIERLNVNFNKKEVTQFLLSTRFLFQNLDRVQLLDLNANLLADTDTLDVDKNAFAKQQNITELRIDEFDKDKVSQKKNTIIKSKKINISDYIQIFFNRKNINEPLTINKKINNNYYLVTISGVIVDNDLKGYIAVSEIANDILIAVSERKNFILRTAFSIALVIFIFSIFLNQYILKPIKQLLIYIKAIQAKDEKINKLEKFSKRKDELGQLSRSLSDMTNNLQKRINIAENFSTDLAHEIRNPLTSLKSAAEILDITTDNKKKAQFLKIISHDVERIERLITDYSQMLKDEASLSRTKMEKVNLLKVINSVVEDFNNDLLSSDKKVKIFIKKSNFNSSQPNVFGVENRLEQILANLLDNAVSFSPNDSEILVSCDIQDSKVRLVVEDQGSGFNENDINQIFKRFYSNRPEKFGEHSGLGLNIVKNILELHGGSIIASNKSSGSKTGARIEVLLPVYK